MATQLRLRATQIADMAIVGALGPDRIKRIRTQFESINPAPLRPDRLVTAVKEVVGDDDVSADGVVRLTLFLCGIMRQSGLTAPDLFQGIQNSVDADPKWTSDKQEKWKSIEVPFRELVACRATRLVATAIDLSYEYANLFQRARILTDIRPLFDEEGTAIEASVISHTLRLRYDSVDGEHGVSIALDEADIKLLAQQCERALTKARTAREAVSSLGVPTVISGEQPDV